MTLRGIIMETFARYILLLVIAALAAGCGKKEEAAYTQTGVIMSVQAQVKVYGADAAAGKPIADAILNEFKRVSEEFSFTEPYSQTSLVNKKAYAGWVKVDDEFLRLLGLSLSYYQLTGGAFDITFAPLWPIWREAASSRKMPAKEEIAAALENIGSNNVQVDADRKMVRFLKPVQINMGGILRGYCFVRAYGILKQVAPAYPVEVRLGGNMLAYGKRPWKYAVTDPFHDDKTFGTISFDQGVVMSSSGRERFVQIEGKLYSHLLDLKTGYPLENFSNLIVYFPRMENENYLASAMLAVMGKEKAFSLMSAMKGSTAVWIDGQGVESVLTAPGSTAKWERTKSFF